MRLKMKSRICPLLVALGFLATGCHDNKNEGPQVVSKTYIHKYGYTVSEEEWTKQQYPGQIITNLENGVTITSSYESNELHGPCTHTYPHSQITEVFYLYDRGNLTKEIHYDIKGIPQKEIVYISPSRYSLTLWYPSGAPKSVEEYTNAEVVEGQYFNLNNETEARVVKGNGTKIVRDAGGFLTSKETVVNGSIVKRETFYKSGSPESISTFLNGNLHGLKSTFQETGEPLSQEEWLNGKLHGKSTFFKNGAKYLELSYLYGVKNGFEVHYMDGEKITQKTQWENDKKHGPSTYFVGDKEVTKWFYENKEVSQKKFENLNHMDEVIGQISDDVKF